jgi:hypothetical protein
VVGACECDSELLGSSKCGEFLDKLSTCQLLRKGSASWSCLVGCLVGWLFS